MEKKALAIRAPSGAHVSSSLSGLPSWLAGWQGVWCVISSLTKSLELNDYAYRHCWFSSTSFPGIRSSISTTGTPTSRRTCPLCFPQSCSGSRKAEVASTNTISRFDLMRVQLCCNLTSESLYTLLPVSNTYCFWPFFYSTSRV